MPLPRRLDDLLAHAEVAAVRIEDEKIAASRRCLDDLLAHAQVLAERDDDEEIETSRRRIEAELFAEATGRTSAGAASCGFGRPHGTLAAYLAHRDSLGAAVHKQAARDLRELSALVLRSTRAADQIAHLAATREINPEGALTFACLLHLADREDGAEVLWQFAAGAENVASAACLYLLHLKRGDVRDARHWARQANALETLDIRAKRRRKDRNRDSISARCRHKSASSHRLPTAVPNDVLLLHTLHALKPDDTETGDISMSAFHARTDTLSHSLTQAVQNLETETHPEYGPITWPDQNLATELQQAMPA